MSVRLIEAREQAQVVHDGFLEWTSGETGSAHRDALAKLAISALRELMAVPQDRLTFVERTLLNADLAMTASALNMFINDRLAEFAKQVPDIDEETA